MGRELRRVPLDFDWPLGKVWEGYVNPHGDTTCPDCNGRGEPKSSYWLCRWVDLLVLAAEEEACNTPEYRSHCQTTGRLYPHPYLLADDGINVTSADDLGNGLLDVVERLYGEKLEARPGGWYGSSVGFRLMKRILSAAGLDWEQWCHCFTCDGEGVHPDSLAEYRAWQSWEPPDGPGFQLWETTSEGAPVSPVFETLDALCEWAELNATTFGSFKATAAEWRKMLDDGLVCHKEGNRLYL